MAVIFCDSFDHYALADRLLKWTADCMTTTSAGPTAGAGRNGTKGYRFSAQKQGLRKSVANNIVTGGAAWGLNRPTAPDASLPDIMILLDGMTRQISVRLSPTGALTVCRGTTVLGTASALFTFAIYHHLELQVTIDPAAGVVKLWLDSILVLSLTGQNTRNTANSYFNGFAIGDFDINNDVAGAYDYDDVILWETDPVGDCRVECLFPTGAGTTTGLTPSAGANYECVDDAAPNGDTDYVSSATPGTFDTYATGNLTTAAGIVKAVQTVLYARKDDAGAHTVKPVIRSGTTDYPATAAALAETYAMLTEVHSVDPNTAAAWTIAGVNAAEFGAEMES